MCVGEPGERTWGRTFRPRLRARNVMIARAQKGTNSSNGTTPSSEQSASRMSSSMSGLGTRLSSAVKCRSNCFNCGVDSSMLDRGLDGGLSDGLDMG